MIRNDRPWSLGDIGFRLFILGLAALLLMALQVTGQLEPVQSFVTQLTSPAQVGTTGMSENVTDAVDFLFELRQLRQRNSELEKINSSLLVGELRAARGGAREPMAARAA